MVPSYLISPTRDLIRNQGIMDSKNPAWTLGLGVPSIGRSWLIIGRGSLILDQLMGVPLLSSRCKNDFKFTIYLIKNKRPTCYFSEYISCKRSLLPNYFETLPFEDWINEDSLNHMFNHLPDKNVNYLAKFVVFNKTLFSLSEGMESSPVLRKRL